MNRLSAGAETARSAITIDPPQSGKGRTRLHMLLACAALSGSLLHASGAFAQDSAAQPSQDPARPSTQEIADSEGTIEEITIVARKRAESSQAVPIAVSVLSSDLIQEGHLQDVSDFVELVPNANYTQESNTSAELSIRGSGRNNADEDPSVGLYRDGIYVGAHLPT